MKKRSFQLAAVLSAVVILLGLGGCGGSDGASASSTASYYDQKADYNIDEEYEATTGEAAADSSTEAPMNQELAANGRKLITTVHISAETEDYDDAMAWLNQELAQAGGYMENSEMYSHDFSSRRCDLTIRVPADRLNGFLSGLEEHCNVLERSVQEDDVTLDYVDTESHKEALLVEQERLLELLARADELEDILNIEDRLTQVRYQLQNYESALRTYDSQINYSTIYMSLREVRELTEPEPESWGSRALRGMRDNARDIAHFFQELSLFIVTHLPALGLLAVIAAVVLLVTQKPRKAAKEQRRRAKEALQAQQREYLAAMEKKNAQTEEKK